MRRKIDYNVFSLSERALTIDFGNVISVTANDLVLQLADYFEQNRFAGFLETVPAYSSLTVFYDLVKVKKTFPIFETAFEAVKFLTENALENLNETVHQNSETVEIPVCFDEEFALDLKLIAARNNLAPDEIINIFLDKTYRVFMLGFLPGFAYMGEIDERLAMPRKLSPRLKIPAGSVGIAGSQTGIYPLESPGGWQIIGRTPLKLFTPEAAAPTLLKIGDSIKFKRISKRIFDKMNIYE